MGDMAVDLSKTLPEAVAADAVKLEDAKPALQSAFKKVVDNAQSIGFSTLDVAGRVAEGIDNTLKLPDVVGRLSKYIPVPGAEIVGTTVGSIFSLAFRGVTHTLTLGSLKWLQAFRRYTAVNSVLNDTLAPDADISSATVKGYLSGVKDPTVRKDLGQYFKLSKQLAGINESKELTPEQKETESKIVRAELARYELRLSRRAELTDLKRIAGFEKTAQISSEAELSYQAERMADTMIARMETFYKDKGVGAGFKVGGEWAQLAAKGESGRIELVQKIKGRLLDTYLAERNGENVQEKLGQIRTDLTDAFMARSTMREAVFYTVLGALTYTGTLPAVIDGTIKTVGWVGHQAVNVASAVLPEWVTQGIANAFFYAKVATGGVLSWLGLKTGLDIHNAFGGHRHEPASTPHDVRADAAHHTDVRGDVRGADATVKVDSAPHAADGSGVLEAMKARLADASSGTSHVQTHTAEVTSQVLRAPVDVAARPDIGHIQAHVPHADVRSGVMEGHVVDPVVKVELSKVNPR